MSSQAQVSAFILAGGKSRRMGQDKAELLLHGRRLLDIAVETARDLTSRVAIVGPRSKFGDAAIEDVFPGCGPLAGIHAALLSSESDLNLMLSVDTPFLRPEFLRWLSEEAARHQAVVTVPVVAGGMQPLCAVYRKMFAAVAESALQAGEYKIDPLFEQVPTHRVSAQEMNQFAFDARMFDNLNTREDLTRASEQER